MKSRVRALLGLLLALGACSHPKYAPHESVFKDFTCSAPWGWSVMTDAQAGDFTQVSFIGPFDEDFFLGAPSLSVRWYRNRAPRKLRDGGVELYSSAADFVRQTLTNVYGERQVLYGAGEGGEMLIDRPQDITLKSAGLAAKYFVVLSPAPAPESNRWGVEQDKAGRTVNLRKHAYAVVPLGEGFYVLTYPATRRGYERYEDRFRALLGSFRPLTAGPGGPKLAYKPPVD